MPLNRTNTRSFQAKLFATELERLKLHKREDDQRQGNIKTYILYRCRRSQITKTGETIQGDMAVSHQCVWHIPKKELDRVGISYLNSLDILEQIDSPEAGNFWQPEATTSINIKLFGNEIDLLCLLTNPPLVPQLPPAGG